MHIQSDEIASIHFAAIKSFQYKQETSTRVAPC